MVLDRGKYYSESKGPAQAWDPRRFPAWYSPGGVGGIGIRRGEKRFPENNRARLAHIARDNPIIPLNDETSRGYGCIHAQPERSGNPIGATDLWIAMQALAWQAVAATDNVGKFSRVSGLVIENWLEWLRNAREWA